MLEMKLGSSLSCCSLQTHTRWAFWSSLSSLGTNLAEMCLMFKLSAKMRWKEPYDSYTISQTSWIVYLRSARIASRAFVLFSGVVLVDCRPERSSSSTDVRPSLKRLYHKKVLLWLMTLSPKASCSIRWVSAAVILKTETKFDADSLLLQIRHNSCKKIAESLQHNLTKRTELKNTSCQHDNCWHTDSQTILLATSSGGRAYDNWFGGAV